nr:TadE/TadG family type IV pilus assembly protein [Antarcticirhabdus aurantiaca]
MSKLYFRFCRSGAGNFGIMAGLVGIMLAAALGGAVDLSRQYRGTSALQAAVDAIALSAAKQLEKDIDAAPDEAALAIGRASLPPELKSIPIVIQVDKEQRTVKVAAEGSIKPSFLPLVRIDSMNVAAMATSSIQRKQYTDFYVLVDASESMNIAASDDDRKKLEAFTAKWMRENGKMKDWRGTRIERPCAFACHIVEPEWADKSVYDMNQEALQKQPSEGARLRIDVVRDAVKTMTRQILGENAKPNSMWKTRISTAFFSDDFAWGIQRPTDLGGDVIASLEEKARPVASKHTNFANAFNRFNAGLGDQGTGERSSDPEKIAILITDGVRDTDPWFGSFGLGPLDPKLCKVIKDKGMKLVVLEVKYVANYDKDGFFKSRVSGYYDGISEGLRDCASSGLHFVASDADNAAAKLLEVTKALLPSRRLVQ